MKSLLEQLDLLSFFIKVVSSICNVIYNSSNSSISSSNNNSNSCVVYSNYRIQENIKIKKNRQVN